MKSIATRFLLPFGLLAVAFSVFVLYRAYDTSRRHASDLLDRQAALALEFNLAIRDYAAQKVRPVMERLLDKDEFLPETMSTSFISRSIFEEVRKKFPEFRIHFASDHPRNPINQANPDELRMIEYFRQHPQVRRRTEEIQIDGQRYLAHFTPKWMTAECMRCHGEPQDAPAALVRRYGATASFHRKLGDVAALDTVAVPVEAMQATLAAEMRWQSLILAAGLALLFGSVIVVFRRVVTRRLTIMATHFQAIAAHPETPHLVPVEVGGRDEIGVVAVAFNRLVEQLRAAQGSLEQRVSARTAELARANAELERQITERRRTEEIIQLRLRLTEYAAAHSLEQLLQKTIDEVGALTNSPVGFYHFVEPDQKTLSLQAWSTRTLAESCQVQGQGRHYSIDQAGVWTDCVRERRPVIQNDSASLPHREGLPEGYAPLTRELVVPILREGLVVSILGVGNKPREYTEQDVEAAMHVADLVWDVVQHKRAEQALQRFQFSIDQASDAVFLMNREAGFSYVNDQACRSLGRTRDELMRLRLWDVDPVYPRERWDETWRQWRERRGTEQEAGEHLETLHRRKDGTVFPVEVSSKHAWLGDQELHIAFVRDITERKRAEEALRESRQILQTVLDTIPARVFWKDLSLNYLGCNRAVLLDAGLSSPEALVGKSDFDMVWASQAEAYRADDRRVIETDQPRLNFEETQTTRDGRTIWLRTSKVPLRDARGQIYGILGTWEDITEQRQVEAALRETEFFLNKSQHIACIGSYKFEIASGTWIGSPSLDEIMGIDAEFPRTVDGWLSLVAPHDRERMRDHLIRHELARGQRFEQEYRLVRPRDGAERWVRGLGELEFDARGNLLRMIGTIQDITGQRRAEEALRESEERFRHLFEHSRVVMLLVDPVSGAIAEANAAAAAFYGYARETLCRMVIEDINMLPPQQVQGARQSANRSERDEFIFPHRLATGEIRDVEVRSSPVNVGGRRLLFSIVQDITERKQAEQALAESERKYRELVQNANSIILRWNPQGEITFINEFGQTFFGYTEAELLGRHVVGTIVPESESTGRDLRPLMEQICADPRAFESNVNENMCRDGRRVWVAWTNKTLFDPQGQLVEVFSIGTDITERRRVEEEVRRLNVELEQRVAERTAQLAAANEELEAFSYSVSHDLRAPLRAIHGFSQALKEDCAAGLDELGRSHLGRVQAASRRMEQLIDDLLKLSRVTRVALRRSSLDVSALADSVVRGLRETQPDRVVECAVQPHLAAEADPGLMRIVLENLLGNAWKFTRDCARPRIEFGARLEEGRRVFFVQDNGAGFDMAYAAKLFSPFQRLHSPAKFEGTGIGLATVQRILRRHGGHIWARSEVGAGAIFCFTIPGA
jgi:PAS domain S-box-containing protein